jgi:saccharopine dehydrogenase-like NADP-dependent oxidoreductase
VKTLVLGGYGNFGARISRALAPQFTSDLLVGGRDARQAASFAQALGHGVRGIGIDLSQAEFSRKLSELAVGLVVHTAGPFQVQGYAVAKAAAEAGAHYIDLSDGRRFVCDFPGAMNTAFQRAGRTAVSGASTLPALSSAVVDHLCKDWQRIDSIDICIAPAQSAPRGRATIAGVLSYCGAPITVWCDGQWQVKPGWASPVHVEFARLKPRRGALCDVPDLELFPRRYAACERVSFRAALEVAFTQHAFAFMAGLRVRGLLSNPAKLAGVLNASAGAFDFLGTSVGGMVVRAGGVDGAGRPRLRAWHLTAGGGHGPEIPCMAAILLAQRLAQRVASPLNSVDSLEEGAFACAGLLRLDEFEPQFKRWQMVTDVIEE